MVAATEEEAVPAVHPVVMVEVHLAQAALLPAVMAAAAVPVALLPVVHVPVVHLPAPADNLSHEQCE